MHERKTTETQRRSKRHRKRVIWLSMALSQLACARQCALRQQFARVTFHRDEALALLEQIGLHNLQVKPLGEGYLD